VTKLPLVREWQPGESIDELTDLLHRAYARLGEMGLNFTAVDQSPEVTARRIAHGTCFVAVLDDHLVGTLTVNPPYAESVCHYYRRPDVAAVHQLAVAPELQGTGIGARLLDAAECWGRHADYRELAIDTAEPAVHLLEYYRRRGFEAVDRVRWPGKTYESIVLRKMIP
jgi:GNAT superfamily N-acetyltransferase